MKRFAIGPIAILGAAGFALAQVTCPTQEALGAHNVYGRGCTACHVPHSGTTGNGAKTRSNSDNLALWGQNLSPPYGQALTFGGNHDGGRYAVTLPNCSRNPGDVKDPRDDMFSLIACLSCHDGVLAKRDMTKGSTVETITIAGRTFNPPTLLGNDASKVGEHLNDHPVGPRVTFACGGQHSWDCTVNADGSITFTGPNGREFIANYFDVTLGNGPLNHLVKVPPSTTSGTTVTSNSWVTCTTCHDQHNWAYFSTSDVGTKPTHLFVRGWYDPGNSATSNSAAQFCRSCHGGESNEAHGLTVPTT